VEPTVTVSESQGVTIVDLRGEHDVATSVEVRDVLDMAVRAGTPTVVELSLTDFIDSSILGVLLGGLRQARDAGLGFVFVVQADESGPVHRTLGRSGLLAFFPVRRSIAEAIEAARAGTNQPGPAVVLLVRAAAAAAERPAAGDADHDEHDRQHHGDLQREQEEPAEEQCQQQEEEQEGDHAHMSPAGPRVKPVRLHRVTIW
jgi:anti-sigma B factor antagonist